MNLADLRQRAKAHGQDHVFAFWDKLAEPERQCLASHLFAVDFALIDRLKHEFLAANAAPVAKAKLSTAPIVALPKTDAERKAVQAAHAEGEKALRAGRLGCFLVAGGQGTRLGFNSPKGCFEIGPITTRSLFQVHAEKIAALRRQYGAKVPWVIMTSDANDAATKAYFEEKNFYGLGKDSVRFCVQANMPAVAPDGKLLLESKSSLALAPNGHGGSIKALHDSGALQWLRGLGVDTLFYFQVDNALNQICDPAFVGRHLLAGAEMSSKVVRKRDWKEPVGVIGHIDGKLGVIEYSDLPEDLAKATDPGGALTYWAGSIAIHVLAVGFVERLNKGGFQLPYHKARKAVQCIGPDGAALKLKPGEKNGVKFETFVFDALPLARATVTVETAREDDFGPVKNAEGEDSPATARAMLTGLYARWLAAAGCTVPRKPDGTPDCRIEIAPGTSLFGEGLEKYRDLKIAPGSDVVI
ncbi:MAG: UTP--glucose-1-phosphate uridylyltransferase [Planctomycetes bacterium]|nr:UTP--glucose-1-phosphate uridylyltransferase [Planctomycetota bacterium]